jgi:hypothetical protein
MLHKYVIIAACLLYAGDSFCDTDTDVTLLVIALGNKPINGQLIASLARLDVVAKLNGKQKRLYDKSATQDAIKAAQAAQGSGSGQVLNQQQFDDLKKSLLGEKATVDTAKTDKEILEAFKAMYQDEGSGIKLLNEIAPDGAAAVKNAVNALKLKTK